MRKLYEPLNAPEPPTPWWVYAVQLVLYLAVTALAVGALDLLVIAFKGGK